MSPTAKSDFFLFIEARWADTCTIGTACRNWTTRASSTRVWWLWTALGETHGPRVWPRSSGCTCIRRWRVLGASSTFIPSGNRIKIVFFLIFNRFGDKRAKWRTRFGTDNVVQPLGRAVSWPNRCLSATGDGEPNDLAKITQFTQSRTDSHENHVENCGRWAARGQEAAVQIQFRNKFKCSTLKWLICGDIVVPPSADRWRYRESASIQCETDEFFAPHVPNERRILKTRLGRKSVSILKRIQ